MKPLRVGLMLDSFTLKDWQALAIRTLQEYGDATIDLIVLNGSTRSSSFRTTHLLYRLYSSVDRFLFGSAKDAFHTAHAEEWLAGIPTLVVHPVQNKYTDVFSSEDVDRINEFDLDILVRFGFRILKGEILHAAEFGVWSYHHDDPLTIRGGPPGFWEVMEQHPVTGSVLQMLTEDLDSGNVLYRSFSITDPSSVIRNRNNYYYKTALFLARSVRQLRTLGAEEFQKRIANSNAQKAPRAKLYRNPSNAQMLALWIRLLWRMIRSRFFDWIYLRQWVLLFSFQNELPTSMKHFRRIVPPPDRFWADPHVIRKENTSFVFFEEFQYGKKGHISLVEIDAHGNPGNTRKILERPYHLSYPFVFEVEGEYFMVPETQKNRSIELYHCVNFPWHWEFKCYLMKDVLATDTTLFYHNQKWWMFTCFREHEKVSPFDELFLFYSEDLFAQPWQPHPMNPIVSDCRSARPAGRMLQENGRIYRPAQNSSFRYGYGIAICEITELSETDYAEQEVLRIDPKWEKNVLRVHTLSRAGNLYFSDAQIARPRWR